MLQRHGQEARAIVRTVPTLAVQVVTEGYECSELNHWGKQSHRLPLQRKRCLPPRQFEMGQACSTINSSHLHLPKGREKTEKHLISSQSRSIGLPKNQNLIVGL